MGVLREVSARYLTGRADRVDAPHRQPDAPDRLGALTEADDEPRIGQGCAGWRLRIIIETDRSPVRAASRPAPSRARLGEGGAPP